MFIGLRCAMSCTVTFWTKDTVNRLMKLLRVSKSSTPVVPGGSLASRIRHDRTFCRQSSGPFFLMLFRAFLNAGLFLAT